VLLIMIMMIVTSSYIGDADDKQQQLNASFEIKSNCVRTKYNAIVVVS